ncbi:unnamed protein product [Pleuronectes platessa]|uniref:Acyl-CoA thioester hydrolase/bile acid-CoA amino acid N-acetyltransferase domain-containing protein n=1 Tax=Pleuronectes platessa TaxID=8262 RepID=A0A9N7TZG3_PLEPL|nr:unnamed protein product [Pleuronectes platessa]
MSQSVPPIVSVAPSRALMDETFTVLVENLPPGSPVTVRALHHSEDRDYWEAYGHYVSCHRGTVSVSDDLSLGGTYTGERSHGSAVEHASRPRKPHGPQVKKEERVHPHAGDHLGPQGTRGRPGPDSSGVGAHRAVVHGSWRPQGGGQ